MGEFALTNPPFGKKSSVTIANEVGDEEKQSLVVRRDDSGPAPLSASARALQLKHGRAAIVVPDNDSRLRSRAPFGLRVHVGRSRNLHCLFEGGAEVRDAIEFEQALAQAA